MKKIFAILLISIIFIIITGCQTDNNRLQNDEEVANDGIIYEKITLLHEEIKELSSIVDGLILQNNELVQSISAMNKNMVELEHEIEEVNTTLAPKVFQNETIYISDEEITNIYRKALEIYFWFQVGTMDLDCNQQVVIDNQTYCKVDEFANYQELVKYMKSVLDFNIVEELLSTNRYIDVDGKLYGIPADRGTDIFKGEETYEIVRMNEQTVVYKVVVELLDNKGEVFDYETHDFFLKYYTDSKWRFEEFYLFR